MRYLVLTQSSAIERMLRNALFLAIATGLGASTVTIVNPSFEMPVQCAGCYTVDSVTGWTPTASVSTWRPVLGGGQYTSIPDGSQIAAVGGPGPGQLSQDLTATLLPDTTYTLSYWVGQRSDTPLSAYTVSLVAGGVTLASDSSGDPSPGAFIQQKIVFDSGASPAELGQALEISISATGVPLSGQGGGQADFDLFALDASPTGAAATPEPSTVSLLTIILSVIAYTGARRSLRKQRSR